MSMFLPRKTEFTGTGLLTTDQKVSGSNPLGRAILSYSIAALKTSIPVRLRLGECDDAAGTSSKRTSTWPISKSRERAKQKAAMR